MLLPTSAAPLHASPVDWSRVDQVMLDMDGTVLDLAFDMHFWKVAVPSRYAAARGMTYEEALAALTPTFVELQGRLEWYCLDHWSGVTQLDLAALKRELRHDIRPLDGSLDFLRAVRAAGKPLWLVTNAHADSWMVKLEHTGLRHWFDEVVCSHDFRAPKENPDFWTRFADRHPFERSRSLFVDDSLPVLGAARAYGIGQVVAVRKPESGGAARHTADFAAVDGLRDLLPIS